MSLAVQSEEGCWRLRLEGDSGVSSAVELRARLLEGLASGGQVIIDLQQAGELDVSIFQLVWAAGRELEPSGRGMLDISERLRETAREAGFDHLPCDRKAAPAPAQE